MVNIIVSPYEIADMKDLKAAGATTMVVGSPFFSVRSVSYFDQTQLREARQKSKELGLQLYVLVNRFFMEPELPLVREHLSFLKQLDVDGIYFTDMGVFYEAQQLGIKEKLIYNPDTMLTNAMDIQAYLDLGISMCTISKEITFDDIMQIANVVCGEMELLVHGRLVMLDSKRHLVSNYMEFLKQDRNLKDNRNLYLKEEHREAMMPILEDESGTYIYTGFTLAAFEEVSSFVEAGIKNLRVESMFLSKAELCAIVQDYCYVLKHPREGRAMFKKYEIENVSQAIGKGFLYKKTEAKK